MSTYKGGKKIPTYLVEERNRLLAECNGNQTQLSEAVFAQIKSRITTLAEGRYLATGRPTPKNVYYAHKPLPGGLRSIVDLIPPHEIYGDDKCFVLGSDEILDTVSLEVLFKTFNRCQHWYWRCWYSMQYQLPRQVLFVVIGAIVGLIVGWLTG